MDQVRPFARVRQRLRLLTLGLRRRAGRPVGSPRRRGSEGEGRGGLAPEIVQRMLTLLPDPGPSEPPDWPGQAHIRLPGVERMRRRTGAGTPVGARPHILQTLFDPKPERRLPRTHWAPPFWFRMDHKFGAGYPDVWILETTIRKPERPYLLRLDLARILPESDEPVEEKFTTIKFKERSSTFLPEAGAELAPLELPRVDPPMAQQQAIPWVDPPARTEILEAFEQAEDGLSVDHAGAPKMAQQERRRDRTATSSVDMKVPGGANHG